MEKLPYLTERKSFVATRNACKLCTPLGASLVYKGIEGCVPLIHGSQGCATYIRRYIISHFREPVDIASSNFSEETTIFGGGGNLSVAINNVTNQYKPKVIGIASTCLSETIGEDVDGMIRDIRAKNSHDDVTLISASTPSYRGSHIDGFHTAVLAVVEKIAQKGDVDGGLNLFPGMISPADIRYLKEVLYQYGIENSLLPDYSDSLDNPTWDTYHRIPEGGTPISDIKKMGSAKASIEFGRLHGVAVDKHQCATASSWLEKNLEVPATILPLPIGVNLTDRFIDTLNSIYNIETPEYITKERGRLIDSYIDGHKYVFGKRVVVYGDEDFVVSMAAFLDEIGVEVILVASGGKNNTMKREIEALCPEKGSSTAVHDDIDFEHISEFCHDHTPDLLIGNSKGYYIARELEIPLIRVGFPVHDRFGGQRILHVGYRGAQQLYDTIVNAIIEQKQRLSPVGYKYI